MRENIGVGAAGDREAAEEDHRVDSREKVAGLARAGGVIDAVGRHRAVHGDAGAGGGVMAAAQDDVILGVEGADRHRTGEGAGGDVAAGAEAARGDGLAAVDQDVAAGGDGGQADRAGGLEASVGARPLGIGQTADTDRTGFDVDVRAGDVEGYATGLARSGCAVGVHRRRGDEKVSGLVGAGAAQAVGRDRPVHRDGPSRAQDDVVLRINVACDHGSGERPGGDVAPRGEGPGDDPLAAVDQDVPARVDGVEGNGAIGLETRVRLVALGHRRAADADRPGEDVDIRAGHPERRPTGPARTGRTVGYDRTGCRQKIPYLAVRVAVLAVGGEVAADDHGAGRAQDDVVADVRGGECDVSHDTVRREVAPGDDIGRADRTKGVNEHVTGGGEGAGDDDAVQGIAGTEAESLQANVGIRRIGGARGQAVVRRRGGANVDMVGDHIDVVAYEIEGVADEDHRLGALDQALAGLGRIGDGGIGGREPKNGDAGVDVSGREAALGADDHIVPCVQVADGDVAAGLKRDVDGGQVPPAKDRDDVPVGLDVQVADRIGHVAQDHGSRRAHRHARSVSGEEIDQQAWVLLGVHVLGVEQHVAAAARDRLVIDGTVRAAGDVGVGDHLGRAGGREVGDHQHDVVTVDPGLGGRDAAGHQDIRGGGLAGGGDEDAPDADGGRHIEQHAAHDARSAAGDALFDCCAVELIKKVPILCEGQADVLGRDGHKLSLARFGLEDVARADAGGAVAHRDLRREQGDHAVGGEHCPVHDDRLRRAGEGPGQARPGEEGGGVEAGRGGQQQPADVEDARLAGDDAVGIDQPDLALSVDRAAEVGDVGGSDADDAVDQDPVGVLALDVEDASGGDIELLPFGVGAGRLHGHGVHGERGAVVGIDGRPGPI